MAINMTLKVPTIEGESEVRKHEKEIVVRSFKIGLKQKGTGGRGTTGSGTAAADIEDLTITKLVDKSTPLLFKACAVGQHWKDDSSVILTCMKASGSGSEPFEYLKIGLGQAFISSVSTGASEGGDVVLETVTFNFKTMKEEYTPQAADGSKQGVISMGWDIGKDQEMK